MIYEHTNQFYFDKLTSREKIEFHENFKEQQDPFRFQEHLSTIKYEHFRTFIDTAFRWKLTKEGYSYWREISERFSEDEKQQSWK